MSFSFLTKEGVVRLVRALTPHFLGAQQESLIEMGDQLGLSVKEVVDVDIDNIYNTLGILQGLGGASEIGITDVAGNFTATDVEGALSELYASGSTLIEDLASADPSKGSSLIFPSIESLGAVGNGVVLDDAAFSAAASLGQVVTLRHGATYYLSSGVSAVSGTRFVCRDGYATIKLKTGAGGFNSTDLTADKNASSRCVFLFSGVDNVGVEGVVFSTDGVAERVIYPIRCNGGTTFKGCQFRRLIFSGMSAINGGYLSLNTIGDGRWFAQNIQARNCGTALNTWTGIPQITVLEVDNDMIAAVPSYPGDFENIGAYNVLLTGAALATYGQQTDVINIAGISGTDRKGPTGHGVYADGVGEVVDLFCTGASITGIRARNVHNFVAKFIHGARYNHVEIDHVESCGFAVVTFAGSSALVGHTEYNTCRVISAKGIGDSGNGPSSDVAGVLIQENGGSLATCLPRNNVCDIVNFVGSANTDFAVKDNCTVANANNNLVRFDRLPTGMTAFGTIVNDSNTRVKVQDRHRVEATLTTNQTPITSATDTTVAFDQIVSDRQSQLDTGTFKVRLKSPGIYRAHASIRSGLNTGDDVTLKILKNASVICQAASEVVTGTTLHTHTADKTFEITPSEAGTVAADISVVANITSVGTITITDTDTMTFFELLPVEC